MDHLPRSSASPDTVIARHRAPRREIAGHLSPLAARLDAIEDRIHDGADVHRARATTSFGGWDERGEALPLGVGHVGGIRWFSHPPSLPHIAAFTHRLSGEQGRFTWYHWSG